MVSHSHQQATRRTRDGAPNPETAAMRAKILQYIQDNPGATTGQICEHVERSRSTVSKYAHELAEQSLVYHLQGPAMPHGGRDNHFHPGPEPEPVDDGSDDSPIRRFVKSWEPSRIRNQIDCLLFGRPRGVRAVAA